MEGKPRERFYLLPGQGGRAYSRKQRVFLLWAIIVGLAFAGVLTLIMYLLNRKPM
jgi:hypothetical protein